MIDIETERQEEQNRRERINATMKGEKRKTALYLLDKRMDALDVVEATREDFGFQWMLELVTYSDVFKQNITGLFELKAETKAEAVKEAEALIASKFVPGLCGKDKPVRARLYQTQLVKLIKV